MKHQEIRDKFLKYFGSKGHTIVPSSSLLPSDSSVLFTTAGMQQFKSYYTGDADAMKDFGSLNTVSIQKSLRTSDIDEVGDESHLTFFEMLGNFSFGGYWKKEAIEYAYEFITKEMRLKIDYVSVFEGDGRVPTDTESEKIWKDIDPNIIVKHAGVHDNFWGPTGNEGPCGPTTEIYVNGIEIWNLVFNEHYYPGTREELLSGKSDKAFESLETKGIDTGMGLERLAMVVQKKDDIFQTDLFNVLGELLSFQMTERDKRIIADHCRAALFLITDGVLPSNKEQGYVLRRLMRRVITLEELHHQKGVDISVHLILHALVSNYESVYPELDFKKADDVWRAESDKFYKTLRMGLKELEKVDSIDPGIAFKLYESFGLPYEVIKEVGGSKAEALTRPGFEQEMERHREISRAGAEKKFGGHGMKEGDLTAADAEEMRKKTRLHTATHLIVAALQKVLGQKLPQAGSDITTERLRFDFTFPRKVTPEELKEAERIANEIVNKDLPVVMEEMGLQEALDSGASAFFKLKYPPRVKVYSIGEPGNYFSRELCGGPHVKSTGEIGHITITKEESVSGGRRIRAVVD